MSKPLPTKDFKWKRVVPTEEEILKKKENAKNGWILEVDLEYPLNCMSSTTAIPWRRRKRW